MGFCDNLVIATYMSPKCLFFHSSSNGFGYVCTSFHQTKFRKSRKIWSSYYPAEFGELNCFRRSGRLAEPKLFTKKKIFFQNYLKNFRWKNFLITAGYTYEAKTQFVRKSFFWKMGFSLAGKKIKRGAKVILISRSYCKKWKP